MTFDQWWEKIGSKELTSIQSVNRKYLMRLAWDAALANVNWNSIACDACGCQCNDDGTCKRSQRCNSE
jgi:hypothetical protein